MSVFHVTPRAARDLDTIADWTLRHWGADRMKQYLHRMNDRFRWLAVHPMAGRARGDVADGYRSFPEGQHVVFYIVQTGSVAIIGIPHQAMDVGVIFD